jgi:phenylalanyl-tRNA synthetase beta chain
LPLARLQDCLVDRGYQEAITYSFVDEAMQSAVAPGEEFIRIQNPISSELAVMRTTLWCGLLNAALYNLNRQQNRVRLFEAGLRFFYQDRQIQQRKMLSGVALGTVNAEQWGEKTRKLDFFDIKADVEALFDLTGLRVDFVAFQHPALHPGQTAQIKNQRGEAIGLLGMLHPTLEKQLGFGSPVFLFELDQDAVLQRQVPQFSALSKYPSVRRDMALLVEEGVSVAAITGAIEECRETAIREISIFDIYRGPGVAEGYKSVALALVLQDFAQTLTDIEIDAIFRKVLDTLAAKLNAKLRE